MDELAGPARVEQLAVLAGLGFDSVEWSTRDAARLSPSTLREELGGAGLRLSALGTGAAALRDGLSLSSPDERLRREARRRASSAVELAGALDALAIVGLLRGEAAEGAGRRLLVDELRRLAELAGACGTRVVLEPINRYEVESLPTLRAVLDVLDEVAHPAIAAMADLFHMNIEEPNPLAALTDNAGGLAYVHVADSNRLAPGLGHLPIAALLERLLAGGYGGPLVCELLPNPTAIVSAREAWAGLTAALPPQPEK